VDGKTARRSHDRKNGLGALHSVSVWASDFGLSLGQVACAEKSNEITAIPELLRLVDIRGAIITIDAMGTQRAIAEQIIEGEADYVLALKGNQETLHQAVIDQINEQWEDDFASVYSGPRKLDHRLSYTGGPSEGGAMAGKRKIHTPPFKARVALAAHKGDRTVNELAGQFDVHPTLIHAWKKQLLAGAEEIFASGAKVASDDAEARQAELFEQIGRLKMELEWLKKKAVVFM
jgi:transposase-like protein